jgi:hypothetical protein
LPPNKPLSALRTENRPSTSFPILMAPPQKQCGLDWEERQGAREAKEEISLLSSPQTRGSAHWQMPASLSNTPLSAQTLL